MGPIGGCICDQLRRALGKGAPDKTLRHRHLETGDVDRPLADNTFKDTFVGTMQEQRARLCIQCCKNPWQRPSQPVNGVAFVAEGVLLGLGAFRFLAAQTAVGAIAMMAFLSRAKTLSHVIYAIYWFNGIQAVLALYHHIRLSPLAKRTTPASPSECAVVSVDGGRPDLVCVVDDEE